MHFEVINKLTNSVKGSTIAWNGTGTGFWTGLDWTGIHFPVALKLNGQHLSLYISRPRVASVGSSC